MAMAVDVFGYIDWLHHVGLLETANIIGSGRGMVNLEVNSILVFDISKNLD